jgi:hypothetical protein
VSWLATVRLVADAVGVWDRRVSPAGCTLGRTIYRETKRSAQIANVHRRHRPLLDTTVDRLQRLYDGVDLRSVRVRTRCRLPANQFRPTGSIHAMTFGTTIYFRDELDEADPMHVVRLIHELVHVDQSQRLGGESEFACAYGRGYVEGGGELPAYVDEPTAYHRNPLESEAYMFEARFRDDDGRVVASRLPQG